jgi:hypothetical protein
MCLDRHSGRNCQWDAALVLRQVMSLLRRNWQDQVFRAIARDQKVLLIDRTQPNEREFAGVARPPQSVAWCIGKPISFRVALGNVLKRSLVDRRWGRCLGSSPRFFELRIVK